MVGCLFCFKLVVEVGLLGYISICLILMIFGLKVISLVIFGVCKDLYFEYFFELVFVGVFVCKIVEGFVGDFDDVVFDEGGVFGGILLW